VEIETECKPHRDSLVQEERRAVVLAAVLAISMVVVPGCRRKERALSNMVNMSDPTTATQLVSGFHAVESGAWRWTMKRFSLILKPPPGSEQNGATLRLKMFLSDEQIKNLGPITVSAEVNGVPLQPQTFSKSGETVYSRPVPPEALRAPSVKASFTLDKAREPDTVDGRQLGVVAEVIGLSPR